MDKEEDRKQSGEQGRQEPSGPAPLPKIRIPLFWKILGGTVTIVIFMLLMSILVLIQLQSLFSSDQSEFKIVPMTERIERLLESEYDLATRYFQTHDEFHAQTFAVYSRQCNAEIDSLERFLDRADAKEDAIVARTKNRQLIAFVDTQFALGRRDTSYNGAAALASRHWMLDSARRAVTHMRAAYIPALSKSLRGLGQQTSNAILTAWIMLAIMLAVGLAAAILLAKSFTRPIQSLKAGTQLVGEGKYETVQISSRDEIADLTIAFNLMSEKLRHLDEMRAQLMSEISHEMRTPLQVIKAGCYTILHTKEAPQLLPRQREAIGMIHQATNRINQFVNSFLDIAKMEAGLMKFNFVDTDLTEHLTPLVQEAELIAQSRGITVRLDTGEIPHLSIDRDRMSQVFSNLLSNALKYTPDKGTITITIRRHDRCDELKSATNGVVRIDVADTGVGIPKDDLEKLFHKFYQAKNVPLVNEKGSGLGLALVKHVTEAHGGAVRVASVVGSGSTFTLFLPV